jgi:hypothetical protein
MSAPARSPDAPRSDGIAMSSAPALMSADPPEPSGPPLDALLHAESTPSDSATSARHDLDGTDPTIPQVYHDAGGTRGR